MKKNIKFTDMSCMVVGGTSGLGLEIANELLKRGAKVIVAGRNINDPSKFREQNFANKTKLGLSKVKWC